MNSETHTGDVKIWIADDHRLFRESLLVSFKNFAPDFIIEKQASNGKELKELLFNNPPPDILLLDLEMKVYSGVKFLKTFRTLYPDLKIIVLSMHEDALSVIRAIKLKVNGYISKDVSYEKMINAITEVINGNDYFQEDFKAYAESVLKETVKKSEFERFSVCEIDFIKLACSDKKYKSIANEMCVTYKAVDGYRSKVFKKLGIKNRAGLVMIAVENGWVGKVE